METNEIFKKITLNGNFNRTDLGSLSLVYRSKIDKTCICNRSFVQNCCDQRRHLSNSINSESVINQRIRKMRYNETGTPLARLRLESAPIFKCMPTFRR